MSIVSQNMVVPVSVLAQMSGSPSKGGAIPIAEPEFLDPSESEIIRIFGYSDLFESDWMVRLAGAGTALLIAALIYLLIWRLLSLGRKRSRMVGEFDQLLERLVRWLYIPIAVVFIIQQSGISLGNIWGTIAAALALIALGLVAVWSIPSNCFSAFVILSSRFYKVGDIIEIGDGLPGEGLRGRCTDIGMIYTSLEVESPNGKGTIMARVPNNTAFQKQVLIYRDGAAPKDLEEKEQ